MQPVDLVEQLNAAAPFTYEMHQPYRPVADRLMESLIGAFQSGSAEEWEVTRAALSRGARWFLLCYAWERAEQAIRQKSGEAVTKGLLALAIEDGRLDARDNIVRMALLFRSMRKLGLDATEPFAKAADLAVNLSAVMRAFPARSPADRDFSYIREATTEQGFAYEYRPEEFAKGIRRKIWQIKLRKLSSNGDHQEPISCDAQR
jgi:hypothetical protein